MCGLPKCRECGVVLKASFEFGRYVCRNCNVVYEEVEIGSRVVLPLD